MLEPLGKKHGIDPKRRADITIFYGEPQSGLSTILRTSMRREGFVDVRLFPSLQPMADAIGERAPDLVLIDGEMPGGDACGFIKEIREGRIGGNPFVPTIVTSWQGTESRVRKVIDSGSDDLIIKPNSPEQVLLRMGLLAHRRKPFIVTSDYIGPDRRTETDPEVPRIVVPNTLQAKALGQPLDDRALQKAIRSATREVNEERLKRHATVVAQLVGLVIPAYRKGQVDKTTLSRTERLLAVAKDAVVRLRGTAFEPVAELCAALQSVAETILRSYPSPGHKELDLLPRLAEAVMIGFNPEASDARLAEEISSSVGQFLQARAPAA